MPIERFELSIVPLLKRMRMPIPPYGYFAEDVRFELTIRFDSYNDLANRPFQPLRQSSNWLNDGNRTHTQSATNFCPTIRLHPTYEVSVRIELTP